MSLVRRIIKGILPLFFIVSIVSCYEEIEGCLDPNATNFEVDADQACPDCCDYPMFYLSILPKLNADTSANLNYDDFLLLNASDSVFFQIKKIAYYLSQFELELNDGTVYPLGDSITFKSLYQNDSIELSQLDNMLWVDRLVSNKEIGQLNTNGTLSKLQFKMGLADTLNTVIPQLLDDNHALAFKDDSLNYQVGSGYNDLVTQFIRDTLPSLATEMLVIDTLINFEIDLESFEVVKGKDLTVTLRVYYLDWFNDIDIKNESINSIQQQILQNISTSFSLFS